MQKAEHYANLNWLIILGYLLKFSKTFKPVYYEKKWKTKKNLYSDKKKQKFSTKILDETDF